jgi:hypothetical protein
MYALIIRGLRMAISSSNFVTALHVLAGTFTKIDNGLGQP